MLLLNTSTTLRLYLKLARVVHLWVLTGHKLLPHLIVGKVADWIHWGQLFRAGIFDWLLDALPILHVARSATRMHFLAFPYLLNILCLHIVWMWGSTCCIRCSSWTGAGRVLAHLHKMNILCWLTLTSVASLRWSWSILLKAFVLRILIRISINVHALRLYFIHLVTGAGSTWFRGTLIDIPRRIMHETAVVLVGWRGRSSHYLLGLRYLHLHLLNLVHMLYLSFAQVALNLLILRSLSWRFL